MTAFGAPPILGLGNAGGFKMQILDKGNLGYETLEGMTWNLVGRGDQAEPGRPAVGHPGRVQRVPVEQPAAVPAGGPRPGRADGRLRPGGERRAPVVHRAGVRQRHHPGEPELAGDGPGRRRSSAGGSRTCTRSRSGGRRGTAQPGEMIPIAGLIQVDPAQGPIKVNRYQMYPSADLNGFTIPTLISSGQAIEKMEALAKRDLPPGMTLRVDGHGLPAEAGGGDAGRDPRRVRVPRRHHAARLRPERAGRVPGAGRALRELAVAAGDRADRADVPAVLPSPGWWSRPST